MNSTICRLFLLVALASGSAFAAPQDDFNAGRKAYLAGDVVGAMPMLKRAADAGHADAQSLYAYVMDKADYDEEAARYFRLAAEQGHPDGQYGLGVLYADGEGVSRDPGAARQWWQRAGAQGHALAILALSHAVIGGNMGFDRDRPDAEALAWVNKAAELGSPPALAYLARGHRSGAFGAVDVARAELLEARMRALNPPPKKGRQKK